MHMREALLAAPAQHSAAPVFDCLLSLLPKNKDLNPYLPCAAGGAGDGAIDPAPQNDEILETVVISSF